MRGTWWSSRPAGPLVLGQAGRAGPALRQLAVLPWVSQRHLRVGVAQEMVKRPRNDGCGGPSSASRVN